MAKNDYLYEIGQRIRQYRLNAGMSQQELALRVGYTSRSSINKVEAGKVDLSQSKITAFADALGTTPAELLGWSEETAALIEEMSSPSYRTAQEAVSTLIQAYGGNKTLHMTRLVDGKNTLIYYRPFPDNSACATASCILSEIEKMDRDTIGKLFLSILAYKAADDRTRQMVDLALEPFIPSDLEGWI